MNQLTRNTYIVVERHLTDDDQSDVDTSTRRVHLEDGTLQYHGTTNLPGWSITDGNDF